MADPLILFTGLPGAGVSTRMAALRAALAHDNEFRSYEVDVDGAPIAQNGRMAEFELLGIIGRHAGRPVAPSTSAGPPFRLGLEVASQKNCIEVWERRFDDAVRVFEREYDLNGVVISVPIESDPSEAAENLNALISPLRRRYWTSYGPAPWVFLDLTRYETLFCQIVPEMLPELWPGKPSSYPTPFWLAKRREMQELAVKSFCQRWLGDNEFTQLVNAERQRCSGHHRRRVMIQVSSSWGFLADDHGPAARAPANCVRQQEAGIELLGPRFPRLNEAQRSALTTLKLGHPGASDPDGAAARAHVEREGERFFQLWKPIGIVEPIPSVVWKTQAPNMFWIPEIMSSISEQ